MTVFALKLESVKTAQDAHVVVGVTKASEASGPLAVVRTLDPNITHPLRQTEVLAKIPELHGKQFTSYAFQAVVRKLGVKEKPALCWTSAKEGIVRYSEEVVAVIKRVTVGELEAAVTEYHQHLKSRGGYRGRTRRRTSGSAA